MSQSNGNGAEPVRARTRGGSPVRLRDAAAKPRPHDHRGRPGLLRGPDRRLAPPARRRRVGRRSGVRRADRARDAGALLLRRPDSRSTPTTWSPCAGSRKVSFKRPVRIGDTISVAAKVEEVRPLDEDRALVGFDWRVTNQDGELVVRARSRCCGRTRPRPSRPSRPRPAARRSCPSSTATGCCCDPRRQANRDHRRRQPPLDRLRDRPASPGGGRRGRADQLRPRPADDRARGQAPARADRGARARRQQRRGPGGARKRAAGALGRRRRRRSRGRLRAARRDRRRLHGSRPRGGDQRLRDQRLLAQGPGRGRRASDDGRRRLQWFSARDRLDRRPRLRRHRRLAGIRLDGRGEGGAGIGLALSRPRPRPPRRPRQPDRGGPAGDGRGERNRRLRAAGRGLGRGLRSAGASTIRRPSRTRRCSCSPTSRGRSPARSSTSTAESTRWAQRRPRGRPPQPRPARRARSPARRSRRARRRDP